MKNSKSVMNEKLKKVSCKNFYSKTSNSFFELNFLNFHEKIVKVKTVLKDCKRRLRKQKIPRVITTYAREKMT